MPPPPPQVVIVKQRSGCLTAFLVALGVVSVLGFGLFLLFAFALNEAAENLSDSVGIAAESDYSVALTSCTTSALSGAKATGTIENRSTKRQGFAVTVRFTTPDNTLISEDSTHIDTLDVGQVGNWTIVSFAKANRDLQCAIVAVNYTVFDNEG
jgi:hypothetical protein